MNAGPLYAYVDRDDRHHRASLDLLQTHPGPLIIPTLVITEVTYLLQSRLGVDAEIRFLGDLAVGNLIPEPVAPGDWLRIAELVGRTAISPSVPSTHQSSRRPNASVSSTLRHSTDGTSAWSNRSPDSSRCFPDHTR